MKIALHCLTQTEDKWTGVDNNFPSLVSRNPNYHHAKYKELSLASKRFYMNYFLLSQPDTTTLKKS